MTVRYNEARANSPCDDDHKLGALLDYYFLMLENTGVSLEDIISRVVAENVDALEVCLVKSRKLLQKASKTQTKLLTCIVKQKLALEKGHPTKVAHDEATKAFSQTTEQLDWARATIAKHTIDIAHIKALLKDCESMDEESSSSGESSLLESGSGNPPAATPQGQEEEEHDIKMRDVGNDPNLPQGRATQTDPPPETTGDDFESNKDIIIEDKRIVIEGGSATPITPADDRLLDQDDQEEGTGAKTPSGAVTKLLSQMNMDLLTPTLAMSDSPGGGQDA